MGWKTVRDHYKIGHIVQIREKIIFIGSPYIPNLIKISLDGKIIQRYKDDRTNKDLRSLQEKLDVDEKSGLLKKLIDKEDIFIDLKPIYTDQNGRVIKKWCEEYNYPNICSDGSLIYSNTFYKDRSEAVEECRRSSVAMFKAFSYSANNIYRIKEVFNSMKKVITNFFKYFYYMVISYLPQTR